MKHLRTALFLSFIPASSLMADAIERDDALKLPQTLITGNRQVEARSDSSSANTVFTRADIDRLQPTSLSDLLGRVPGVQVARSGGRGALPGIYIRGTKSAQSLVLVDGQRMANATSADSNLQYLNIDQIERVEVLRGSRSVIYGSDAIGGVIQIFTRRGAHQAPQLRLHSAMGSYGSSQNSVGVSGGDAQTRFNLSGALEETAGINRTTVSYPVDNDHDAYRNKSVSLNLNHSLNDTLEVGISAIKSTGKTELDAMFGQQGYSDFDSSSVSSAPPGGPSGKVPHSRYCQSSARKEKSIMPPAACTPGAAAAAAPAAPARRWRRYTAAWPRHRPGTSSRSRPRPGGRGTTAPAAPRPCPARCS